jgi:hypothetical protein
MMMAPVQNRKKKRRDCEVERERMRFYSSTATSWKSPLLSSSMCSPQWTGPSLRKRNWPLEASLLRDEARRCLGAALIEASASVVKG